MGDVDADVSDLTEDIFLDLGGPCGLHAVPAVPEHQEYGLHLIATTWTEAMRACLFCDGLGKNWSDRSRRPVLSEDGGARGACNHLSS